MLRVLNGRETERESFFLARDLSLSNSISIIRKLHTRIKSRLFHLSRGSSCLAYVGPPERCTHATSAWFCGCTCFSPRVSVRLHIGPPSRAAAPKSAIEMTGWIFQSFGSASLHACCLLYISSIANGPTLLSESLRFGHPGDAEVVLQVEHHCVPLA